jgi:hypothetical protein
MVTAHRGLQAPRIHHKQTAAQYLQIDGSHEKSRGLDMRMVQGKAQRQDMADKRA